MADHPFDPFPPSEPGYLKLDDCPTHEGDGIVVLGADGKTPIGTLPRADIEKGLSNLADFDSSHITPEIIRGSSWADKAIPRGPHTGRMGVRNVKLNTQNLTKALGTNPCGEISLGSPQPCVLKPLVLGPDQWHNTPTVEPAGELEGWDDHPLDP